MDSVVSKAFSSVSVKPEREDSIHSMAMVNQGLWLLGYSNLTHYPLQEIGPTGDEVGQKVVTEPHDESALKIAQLSSSCQERFNHLWAQVNTAVTLEERQTAGQTLLSEYEQNLDEEAVAVIQGLSSSQTDPNIEVVDFPFEDDTQYSDPNEENGAEMAPDTEKQIEDNSQNSDPNVDKDKEALTNEMDGADTALDREEQREYTSPRSAVDSDPLQVNCSQLEPNVAAEKACSAALIAGKEEGLPKEIPFVMSGGLLPESEEVTQQSLLPPRRKRGRPRKHFNNLATPSRPTIPSALFSISQVSSHSNSIYDNGVASPSLKIEDPSISGPFKALPSLGGPIGVSASRRRRGRPRKVPLSEQSQSVSQPSDKSSMSQGSRRSARTPKQVSIFDPTPGKRAKNEPSLDDEEKERLPIKAKRGRPRKVTTTLIAKRPKTSQRASTKKDEGEEDVDEEKEDENEDDDEGAEDEDDAVRERRANQREYNRRYREKVRASEEHRRRKAESQRKWTEKKLRENPLYFVQARMAKNGEVTVQRKKKANKPKASKHTRTRGAGNANRQSRTKYVEPESDE